MGDSEDKDAVDDFIDHSQWPVLYISFPKQISKDLLDVHFSSLRIYAKTGEKFAAIVSLDAMVSLSRELRQYAAAHLKKLHLEEGTKFLVGVAHVSNNWLSRASLTVVVSLSPPPYPNRVFRRQKDAELWVKTLLPTA